MEERVRVRLTLGSRVRQPGRAELSRRVSALVRETLALDAEALLTISEIACADPQCGGAETVVLVMRPGRKTAAFKMRMPVARIEADDIARSWAESEGSGG